MNATELSDLLNELPDDMIVSAYQRRFSLHAAEEPVSSDRTFTEKSADASVKRPSRRFAAAVLAACMLAAVGAGAVLLRGQNEKITTQSLPESELPADSKAETELPVHYISNTSDRRLPASYTDLVNLSDAVVIAEATAEKKEYIEKDYNPIMGTMKATGGYTVVSYKVDRVLKGDVKEGDILDIREYHYNWFDYQEDGTTADCIVCRSDAKPSVTGETYLLYLVKRSDEETWDLTFDEFSIYTYDGKKAGPWRREDMEQESREYTLYQYLFREVAAHTDESEGADG